MVLGKKGSLSLMNKSGGYVRGISCISIIDSPEICNEELKVVAMENVSDREELKANVNRCCSSTSTSSIGKNSDDISGRTMLENNSADSSTHNEVQSSYKGPLDSLEALEEVLPIRRSISNFYNGKSKSFASLADASSSSSTIKDISKPENAYSRKRRNLLAWNNKKNRSSPLRSNGGVSKRAINSSRTSLALALAMSSSGSHETKNEIISSEPPSSLLRTCLHSQLRNYPPNGSFLASPHRNFSAWRSLSLADLQHCISITAACTPSNTSLLDIKPSQT
ncbi:hypothetical protein ACH5RR_039955 [Cinchona calisaya]|uniref:Uncharacterized protein n=1 Tax=Cinchona calisaya TaxID=153742 RepID=A0ABD2XZT0_9GENT